MNIQEAIQRVTAHQNLTADEMTAVMAQIMGGDATPAQIGGFLIGLRMKGETVAEIAAAARVMRSLATPVAVHDHTHLVDTCGTGGDSRGLFNVSTAVAFVVAAAGGIVAKHGNRSVSSRSGSADVLEAAGVRLDLAPEHISICLEQVGVGFLFAPAHHSAMKHAIGPRREMGVRTIFNLLGPLTNPAGAPNQLLGVFNPDWVAPLAEVMRELGSRHVMVVHSEDGLDEISIAAPTEVAELKDGQVYQQAVQPEDFSIRRQSLDGLVVRDAKESLALIRQVFRGEPGPARDIVALNAGAAIYVADLEPDMAAGVRRAQSVIDSGAAMDRMQQLVALSARLGGDRD
ncbi:MAG: anthranilate phosphoribosyltransferase [Pseudomonadota bacterium]|nr:anthranilate phosphoribosyltransferase [Pseudomonadota bacterium]